MFPLPNVNVVDSIALSGASESIPAPQRATQYSEAKQMMGPIDHSSLISECLRKTTVLTIVPTAYGNKWSFNGHTTYDSNRVYKLGNGTYKIPNVPKRYALAIISDSQHVHISSPGKTLTKKVVGTDTSFHYGDITIQVTGDFKQATVYSYYYGHMGGDRLFRYSLECY